MRRVAFLRAVLALFAGAAQAHGGGLNAEGCHNNRKTGDYHCHRAPAVKVQQQAAATPPQQLAAPESKAAPPARPTCYVGPKGGTYTITASGRKNYKGC